MSLLRRLFGEKPSHQVFLTATYFKKTRDESSVEVVGEAYRQQDVLAARPPGPSELPPGLPPPPEGFYKAMLVPEPTNAYDRNAVLVSAWAGGTWTQVGYLSRDDAVRYQPVFHHLGKALSDTSPAITCDAALVPERDGTGVVLHLGTPGECAAELATDDIEPATHKWVGKTVVFTGQNQAKVCGVFLDRPGQLQLASWAGCVAIPRMTKKTDLLIVANADEPTANYIKAREYGTEIIDEVTFLTTIGLPPDTVSAATARWAQR